MTLPTERDATATRRETLARARQSRRPSRLGQRAGTAGQPDYPLAADAGFPGLLNQAWRQAAAAPDVAAAVETLLTLAGHVPADVSLRALAADEECALKVLTGRSWRAGEPSSRRAQDADGAAAAEPGQRSFLGEIGLSTSGRIRLRVPSQGPLAAAENLVAGVLRVPWSPRDLAEYQVEVRRADARRRDRGAGCRAWLAAAGPGGRQAMLENLKEAARRTAPFVLYCGDRQYTNFRDQNTLTGKTLWPGHPDCALSSLAALPLDLWSDSDAAMVTGLTLLVRSAGFGRVEEANGTQLSLDHVAHLLERTRLAYNAADPGSPPVPPAAADGVAGAGVAGLAALADAIGGRRREIMPRVQLYREIHGALMHKVERVAGAPGERARWLEAQLCARLRGRLPVRGDTFAELGASLAAAPSWLAVGHGEFLTGLESLVWETVSAAAATFGADFAMSRGLRSLPALITALREQDWPRVASWDIPHFFCCVVAAPAASAHFGHSLAHLADTAWSISARMQFNSWHFLVANLPAVSVVEARDYFVPPTIPDVSYFSDQHHHGHVAAKVRFSLRSPQPVEVLGRTFAGFIDLRLLRCAGLPFNEQDLLAAQRVSGFIARATSLAAGLVADGANLEVTSFDSAWHWQQTAG